MDTKQRLTIELQIIINKWKDKPEAVFMSKEYIDRRFYRIRYIKLQRQLNTLEAKDNKFDVHGHHKKPTQLEDAKKIFIVSPIKNGENNTRR